MSKRKVYNYTRRTLAFLMAVIMTLSVLQSSTMTVFAQTGSDLVVEETEVSDVIEEMDTTVSDTGEVSETDVAETSSDAVETSSDAAEETSEAIESTVVETAIEAVEVAVEEVKTISSVDVMEDGSTYTGSTFEEDGRNGLEIAHYDMTIPEGSDFETEALAILNNLTSTYQIISLCYDSITDTVDADLWNAALAKLNSENDQTVSIRANFSGGENAPDENWNFDNPGTVESDVKLGVSITLSEENGGGATFKLDEGSTANTVAQEVCVNFNADQSGRADIYNAYQAAFGTEAYSYGILDSEGNEVENTWINYEGNAVEDENVYFNLGISGVQNLAADTGYTVIEVDRTYKGDTDSWTEEDGYVFQNIYLHPANYDEAYFSAEQISDILNYHEEKSFDEITVVYCTEEMGGTVDDAVINAAIPYLKESTEDRASTVRISFLNVETNEEFNWILVNPRTQTADQNLTGSFAIVDGEASVSVGSQSFVADCVNLNIFRSPNESGSDNVEEFKAAFGGEPTALSVGDTDAPAGFDMDEQNAWIWIDDVSKLTADTSYTLSKIVYQGEEFEEDGRNGLEIAHYDMTIPEGSDFETEALAILTDTTNTSKYEIISLCYDSITDTIGADLWNAALAKLNSENDQTVSIRANFSGGENAPDENWNFDNPSVVTSDVKFGVTITLSDENDGGATFKLDEDATVNNIAQEVCANINADKGGRESIYNTYVSAFGTESSDFVVLNSTGNEVGNTNAVYENNTEDNVYFNLGIVGIQNLSVNIEYSLAKRVYKGDYNEWNDNGYTHQNLFIHPGNVDQTSFTAEQITAILENYDKKSLDEITVVYCTDTMGGIVDDAIINAAIPYLKDTEERASTFAINFQNPTTQESIIWILEKPTEQTEDQTLSSEFTVLENGAKLSVGSQSLKAEHVNLRITRNITADEDGVKALKDAFGGDNTDVSIGDKEVYANFEYDEYEAWIWISDVDSLDADTEYTISKYTYKGRIDTWDDGSRELNINFGEAGVECLSEAQLLEILGNYSKEDNISYIYIEQPRDDGNNIIYKSVADAAAALVNTEHTEIKFAFCNHMGANVIWCLAGEPSKIVQTADQNVKAGLWMSEEETAAYISAGKQSLVAPEIGLTFTIGRGVDDPAENLLMKAYGNNWIEIETENHALEGSYFVDDYNVVVNFFGNPNVLNSEEMYKIIKKAYRGHINEWEENNELMRELYLSSADIQKDKFTEEELKAAIQFYIDNNIKFDTVSIQQKYSDNNIIDKDFINMTRDLLVSIGQGELTFVFCSCTDEKHDESGNCIQKFIQSDMNWHFMSPGEATKDINANIAFTESNGNGLSMVLNSNTYNAENVVVSCYMDKDADMYRNKIVPSVGEAPVWYDSRYANVLFAFENGKTLNNTIFSVYGLDTENEKVNLNIVNVQKWKPGIENRLVRGIAIEEPVSLGVDREISVTRTPDSKVTWSSLDPGIASVSVKADGKTGVISALKEYDEAAVMASYKVNNQPCSEIFYFNTAVAVEKVQFARKEVTIEWDGTDPEYREFLKVNLTPTSVQDKVNPQDFEWFVDDHAVMTNSVSGNAIAFDLYPYEREGEVVDYRADGSIRVIAYGTSTVKVKCGASEDTCVINVVKPVEVPEITTQIYALPLVDKTLAAIDLDKLFGTTEGTWEWQNPNTDLALYADRDEFTFSAVYKPKDDVLNRSITVLLPVKIIRIEEVKLVNVKTTESGNEFTDLNYNMVKAGDEVIMNYQVNINYPNTDEFGNITPEYAAFMKYFGADGVLEARWSSKENLAQVTVAGLVNPRKYTASGKGLKNFAVNIVNKQTGKTITSGSGSVFVLQNKLFDFYGIENYKFEDLVDKNNEMSGVYKFTVSEANYMKLTITSGDSSLMKLGRAVITKPTETYKYYVIEVPYTFKDYGTTTLKVTAADEVKSYIVYECERIDNDPKVVESSFTIDKAWSCHNPSSSQYDGPKCDLTLVYHDSTTPAGSVTVNDSSFILYSKFDGGYDLILKDTSIATGSRNVTLTVPITVGEGEEAKEETRTITIPVKITESKNPSVKLKQNQKLNEFYKHSADSDDGIGIVTIDGGKYDVINAWIEGDSIFTLTQYDDNKYAIRVKESVNLNGSAITSTQKKITIGYELVDGEGSGRRATKAFTVKTQNKKPTLVLSKKSDTLYPAVNTIWTSFTVTDKASKETLVFNAGDVKLLLNKREGTTFTLGTPETEGALNKVGKNNYFVFLDENPEMISMYLNGNTAPVKANDKFTFYIQKANWNNYVSVTYTAKVNLKSPSLKLGSKTLTLNANDEVYRYQTAATTVKLNGYGDNAFSEHNSIWITGANAAATNALKNNLAYSWDWEQGVFRVSIVDKGSAEAGTKLKGSYKFKLWTDIDGVKLSTNLTVKIVDKAPAKAVKAVKKGSIDVLTRDTAYMTMNPKLSNLSGEVIHFALEGPDADLFKAEMDENGNCIVKAKYDEYDEFGNLCKAYVYSTKTTYQVTPVYYIADNGVYEVKGTVQKFKVKQGKPKLTVSATGNVIYGKRNSSIDIYFNAMIKDQDISISKVELLNYNYDLNWDDYGNSGTLSVNDNMYQITKAKGKYKLKFAVTYTDKAGNEKVAQTTYNVTILRK